MIHLSNPAAYHDKRFKNSPAKRKTMKTPFPHHPEPRTYAWTKLEEETIKAAMVAAYNEGIEEAAKECEGMKVRAVRSNYEDAYRHAASAIRKMKETP